MIRDIFGEEVTAAFLAFAALYIANTFLGVVGNVLLKGERFDWKRFLNSLLRVIVGAAMLLMLLFSADLVKQEAAVPDEPTLGLISVAAFVLLFWKGYKEGMIGVYEKLRAMFEIGDSRDFKEERRQIAAFRLGDPMEAAPQDTEFCDGGIG